MRFPTRLCFPKRLKPSFPVRNFTYFRIQRGSNPKAQAATGTCIAVSSMIMMLGFAYLSVPLYKVLCQKYGWQGTIDVGTDEKLLELIQYRKKRKADDEPERKLIIRFETRTDVALPWKFEPVQNYVVVAPGETALAFFSVYNYSKRPITAVSTYGVLPFKTGPHFVKVQCFCFEEQRVRAKEKVDMPVLFYIDPEFLNDSHVDDVHDIILSYNFFEVEVEEGEVEPDDPEDVFWKEEKENEMHELFNRGAQMKSEVQVQDMDLNKTSRYLHWGASYAKDHLKEGEEDTMKDVHMSMKAT